MTTWTSKAAALCAALLLAGCEEGAGLAGLPKINLLPNIGGKAPATEARMLGGALTLVAPDGYCVDPKTKRAAFVLLARCDILVEGSDSAGAPIGLISVSIAPPAAGGTLPTAAQITKTKGLGAPSRVREDNDKVVFRTSGPAPGEGLDSVHWRSAALVGDQVLGIALFGPENGRAVSSEGAIIIDSLIERTRRAQ